MKPSTLTLCALAAAATGCAPLQWREQQASWQTFAKAEWQADLRAPIVEPGSEAADAGAKAAALSALLDKPIDAADAVRLALWHSPALQAALAQARAESAARTQARRPPNPVLSLERMVTSGSHREIEITRALTLALGEWLLWPWRAAAAQGDGQITQLPALQALAHTAIQARAAWVQAVAAQEEKAYRDTVLTSAQASAELARRMLAAGNFTPLQAAREALYAAEAHTAAQLATHQVLQKREALVRALGLNRADAQRLRLPQQLPDLPTAGGAPPMEAATEQITQRLDVRLADARVNDAARQARIAGWTPWLSSLHAKAIDSRETEAPRRRGWELEFALPLLDTGDAWRARQQAQWQAEMARAQQTLQEAQSQWREARNAVHTAEQTARHHAQVILPLRKTIADETLLRYNGMLIGPFELMAESRAQTQAVIQALQARRDYWLADAAMAATRLGVPAGAESPSLQPARTAAEPAGAGH